MKISCHLGLTLTKWRDILMFVWKWQTNYPKKYLRKSKKSVDFSNAGWYDIKVVTWGQQAHWKLNKDTPRMWGSSRKTWWTTNNSAADKLGKKQASKEMSQQDLWNFFMRVWSWLRTNAGGVPNTCKSNEPRLSACTWSRWVANGWVTRG